MNIPDPQLVRLGELLARSRAPERRRRETAIPTAGGWNRWVPRQELMVQFESEAEAAEALGLINDLIARNAGVRA